jgi:molybdate transport system regulatory protein
MEDSEERSRSGKGRAMKPHAKLFLFSIETEGLFGDGKWRLLVAVREYGSIQEAARRLGRGYRKAWGDIKRTEEGFGRRIVRKTRGGPSGGRTELTEFGNRLLDAWERYRTEVHSCMNGAFSKHLESVIGDVSGGSPPSDGAEGDGKSREVNRAIRDGKEDER